MTEDYLSYYNLETYLFNTVHARFHKEQKLDSFDLFSSLSGRQIDPSQSWPAD
jgi:hypothetical protein